MEFTASHGFWCQTCGKRLNVGSRDNADGTQEAVLAHKDEKDDTHMPTASFTPTLPARLHRNTQ